ncbi:MAG: PH domain-containing protein [Thermoplasmata archaeon]|nr:PH domain-containing protein [Thermoplasmata archaeon]
MVPPDQTKDFADNFLENAFSEPKEASKTSDSADAFLENAFQDPGVVVFEEKKEKKMREKGRKKERRQERPKPPKKQKPPKKAAKQIIKKKASKKPKPPPIPIDADIPLLPGEEVQWKGSHHRASAFKAYMGFAVAMSLSLFCFGTAAAGGRAESPEFWNTFLVILVVFIIIIFSLVSQSAEGHFLLSTIQTILAALAALMFSTTFLSILYQDISSKYDITVPQGTPMELSSLANLPIASLIFIGMVLLLFVVITTLKSHVPQQYRRSLVTAATVVLLTGTLYMFKPELLESAEEHRLLALYLFAIFLMGFSAVLFFALATKRTRYVITNQRIVVIKIYLGKEAWMKSFAEIEKVKARQGLLGSMNGFGSVILTTTTPSHRLHIIYLHGMPEPFKVENIIYTGITMARSATRKEIG